MTAALLLSIQSVCAIRKISKTPRYFSGIGYFFFFFSQLILVSCGFLWEEDKLGVSQPSAWPLTSCMFQNEKCKLISQGLSFPTCKQNGSHPCLMKVGQAQQLIHGRCSTS